MIFFRLSYFLPFPAGVNDSQPCVICFLPFFYYLVHIISLCPYLFTYSISFSEPHRSNSLQFSCPNFNMQSLNHSKIHTTDQFCDSILSRHLQEMRYIKVLYNQLLYTDFRARIYSTLIISVVRQSEMQRTNGKHRYKDAYKNFT